MDMDVKCGRYGKAASALLCIFPGVSLLISGGRWISRRSSAIELMMMWPFHIPGLEGLRLCSSQLSH